MKLKKEVINKKFSALNKHWQKFWFHYFCTAVIVAGLLVYYIFRAILPTPTVVFFGQEAEPVVVVEEKTEPAFRHPLTGEVVPEEMARPRVFAVMVENSAEAWPLSGLAEAFLVIEAPVEANIPRFVVFYSAEQDVEKIGPVRSARPYYLDWAAEFDALYAHVGGSPEALKQIVASDLLDLNEFWNSGFFWRSSTRSAPHNDYTSSEFLNKALASFQEKGKISGEPDYGLWFFKDDEPAENSTDTDLTLNSESILYQTVWKYDQPNNRYERWQNGTAMKLSDNESVFADNVAVVYTSIEVIDNVGRREIETIGDGDALVLQDGRKIPAVWKKESVDDRLRFYAEDGKEVVWNVGRTWVEIVSTEAFGR